MQNFNIVDCIILVIFFFSMLTGLSRGFIKEVVSLAALIIASIVGCTFSSSLAGVFMHAPAIQNTLNSASNAVGMNTSTPVSYVAIGISFFLLFSITTLIGALLSTFITAVVTSTGLSLGNRLFGAMFGLGRGFLMIVILMFLLQLTPIAEQPWWRASQFVNAFQPAVSWFASLVSPIFAGLKAKLGSTLQGVSNQLHQTSANVSGLLNK